VNAELSQEDDRIVVSLELPGLCRETLEIDITADRLTVAGERRIEQESGDGGYRIVRCVYRPFRRDMRLPCQIDVKRSQVRYGSGVLHIDMPCLPEQ
jgi:HSP20 family protein